MPLNDDEVQQEMRKMVAFIKQEAIEKARELQVKADEEFNIEKAKIVRQETMSIENNYGRKLKQTETNRKIAQSSLLNKMRLEVLQVREQCLNELFEEVKEKLLVLSQDHESYKSLIKDLMIQCLFELLETKVTFQCRLQDLSIVNSMISEISEHYEKNTGFSIQISIDSEYLPANSAGGLIASCRDGKIKIDNSLETRIELLFQKMLPEIRVLILGNSTSRKFFD